MTIGFVESSIHFANNLPSKKKTFNKNTQKKRLKILISRAEILGIRQLEMLTDLILQ